MRAARFGLLFLTLAGCATAPRVELPDLAALPETHTVMSRYPARRSGILIAQNAALSEGRALCLARKLRFRPMGSVAGEDPATGDAVFAVRFVCLPARRAQASVTP